MISSAAAKPKLNGAPPAAAISLEPREWAAITRVDGVRDIATIAADLRLDEMETMKLFRLLVLRDLVKIEAPLAVAETERPKFVAVHPTFFQHLQHEAAAALGPLAVVIIDDAVEEFQATRENFPRGQASRLVEVVGAEIQDDARRVRFQQKMMDLMQSQPRAA